jgi:hypothetical protein
MSSETDDDGETWCADTSDAVFRAFDAIQDELGKAWNALDVTAFYFGEVIDGGLLGPGKTMKLRELRDRTERMMAEIDALRPEIKPPTVMLVESK